jgi:voltage-gated potassium channel
VRAAEEKPVKDRSPQRDLLFRVIFEAETPAGRLFDVLLIVTILASVAVVMFDSVQTVSLAHGPLLNRLEWFFTVLFTLEYLLRLFCSPRPLRYASSFFGAVDLLAILPTYLSIFFPAGRYFMVIRTLRILRVFRVLKLVKYVGEADVLVRALWASRHKIVVFVFSVLTMVSIFGSFMYVIEGEASGFTSIPRSIYWAIVTLTTVGYGDISPATNIGQILASMIMILGYAIIAVPTGIVTAEMVHEKRKSSSRRRCGCCGLAGHEEDALHCRHCGTALSQGERGTG